MRNTPYPSRLRAAVQIQHPRSGSLSTFGQNRSGSVPTTRLARGMMRIAYIGNFLPAHSTENDVKIALETLGVEVVPVQENDPSAWHVLIAETDGLDFVLWTTTHSFDIGGDIIRRILDGVRKAGKPVVGYHLDRWWGLGRVDRVTWHPFFTHTDLVCTPDGDHDAEWAKLGIRHEWFPPAVSGRHVGLAEPDHGRFPHPVVFVGSWRNYHEEHGWRYQMVDALRHRYGRGSSEFGIYPIGGHRIVGADLSTLYATAEVVVGDSCLVEQGGRYWSDRIPETLGRGGILAHPHIDEGAGLTGLLWDYTSGNVDSLFRAIDTARELSTADRTWLRVAGVEAIGRAHTYEHRMERLLGLLGSAVPAGRRRYWSGGVSATFVPRDDPNDRDPIEETWVENVYRLRPEWVEGGVVVDVGANVGAVTVWAAKHGARRVYAIEPEPGNLEALARNLEANGFSDGENAVVETIAAAISGGDATGWAEMSGSGGGARVERWSGRTSNLDPTSVAARPFRWIFDLMLSERVERVDLLKIDIEGGEWPILSRGENVAIIGERVRRMVVEFHDFGWGWEDGESSPFGRTVALLAEVGKVEILGRPSTGGTIWWEAYK